MSSASPSPATSNATPPPQIPISPSSATTPPPPPQQPSSPSPNSSTSLPPETSPPPPPSQSAPPPPVPSVPPPSQPSPPPSLQSSPPPSQSSPPPSSQSSPPPSQSSPPPSSQLSPPPSQSSPPTSPSLPLPSPQTLPPSSPAISPPPPESPVPVPPQSSPPSPPPNPSPPPASPPQENSPPPPTAVPPPRSSPSPPPENSTQTPPPPSPQVSVPPPSASPPVAAMPPPRSSPTPPSASPPVAAVPPPRSSPPPPSASPPVAAVPPPRSSPTPPSASPPVAAVPPPRSSPTPPSASPPVAAVPPPRSSPTPPSASPPVAAVPPPRSSPTPPSASPPVAAVPPPRSSQTPPSASPPTPPLASPPTPLPPPPPSTPPTTPSSQPVTPSNSTPSFQLAPPPPRLLLSPPPPLSNEPEDSSPEAGSSDGISTGVVVVIAVFGGILLLGLIAIALWCLRRKNKKEPPHDGYVMPYNLPSSTESDSSSLKIHSSAPWIKSGSGSDVVNTPSDPGGLGHSRNWFSYEELLQATNGFSTQNLLGEGGFGSVFKGCLPDGREIAVKQLKIGGSQGEREFKAEVEIISRIHHRHLVSLVGYCIQDTRRLLVYDYVPNNTLHFHLHGEGQPVLEWAHRVKIAVGTARGIAYLHEDCNPRVIHRDIKPSNILLDYNYEARVADFGLAKLALDACTHISTRVMGTFGYVAPEYASTGNLTERSDVYSFGVVLLELITGWKAVDRSQPLGDESLVEWARPLLSHALETEEFDSVADERLQKNYIESEMFCMIETAAACVRHSASKRPRMGQVVRAFESLATSDLSNGMRPGESQVVSSTLQSEEIRLFQRMAFNNQTVSTGFFVQDSLHT